MSNYTSGNNAPTQMAQAPNRKGNVSKHLPSNKGGVTSVTRPQGSLYQPDGSQGKASAGGNITGRGQKVSVNRPAEYYCGTIKNDGYMNSDRNNFLK
jgi:hypothetical protein